MVHKVLTTLVCACLIAIGGWAQQPGSLVSSFGNQGKVIVDVDDFDQTIDVVCDSLDRIVVLAQTGHWVGNNFDMDLSLVALLPDGSPDPSFGTNGVVTTDFDTFPYADPRALWQDDAGRLCVLGEGRPLNSADGLWVLQRFLYDGTPDATFGSSGSITFSFLSGGETPRVMAMQPDGKIVVAGASFDTTGVHQEFPVIARVMPDGSFDTTFGTTGKIALNFSQGIQDVSLIGNDLNVNRHIDGGFVEGMIIQPDGKILCVGSFFNVSAYQCMLFRLNTDGTLDTGFGSSGVIIFNLSPGFKNLLTTGVWLPDDRAIFLVTRGGTFGDTDMLCIEVSEVGQFGLLQSYDIGGRYDYAEDIVLGSHNKPVLVGRSAEVGSVNNGHISDYFATTRIVDNGGWGPDPEYDGNGSALTAITANIQGGAKAGANFSNDRLLLAGFTFTTDSVDTQDLALLLVDNSNSVGVEEHIENTFDLWPNPVQDRLFVGGLHAESATISIRDQAGRLIEQTNYGRVPSSIEINHLATGMYFLSIETATQLRSVRFVKQ